jgi:hypothetical protein
MVVACPGQPDSTLDLGQMPPNNESATFELTATAPNSIHEVDGLGCAWDYSVDGEKLHASAGQSCDRFSNGQGGTTTGSVVSLEKATSDGKTMTIRIVGTVGQVCTLDITGTARKIEGGA